jgi:GT2 family glycosyltransferase
MNSNHVTDSLDVSIVIVNWNRSQDVLRTVRYLRFQAGVRFEVVVVDNGSTDGSLERLAGVEGVKVIALDANVGPCKARNIGVENSSARYIVFLDSDAILSKWKLARMVERMDLDPSIGILACRMINISTRELDQWIYAEPASTHELMEFDTYSFSAGGTIVRAAALRDVGMFWDDLFIYNEEVDLSIRLLRAGYRIVHYPRVRVYHCPSDRGRDGGGAYWRFQIRNWIWIFYRHYPLVPRLRKIMSYVGIYLVKSAANRQLKAGILGIIEGLRKTDIIDRYPDKLSSTEIRRIGVLNIRKRIKLGR